MAGKSTWALLKNLSTNETVEFQFNPDALDEDARSVWAEIAPPGAMIPRNHYVRGEAKVLPVETMFDGWGRNVDTRQATDLLERWCREREEKTGAPPICLFIWGAFQFKCIITEIKRKHVLFHPDGRPARTFVSLTLKEFVFGKDAVSVTANQAQGQQLRSQGPKTYMVKQGDTYTRIALDVYGSASKWRKIADANPQYDPRRVPVGVTLMIPA